jgi:uncharacterized protein (TIGR00299 family) protein
MTTLLIDPFSGASGDMLLAALIDAGLPLDTLRERLHAIPALADASVEVETVMRGYVSATRLVVDVPGDQPHRHLSHVRDIIDAAPLSTTVKECATDTFIRLAEVEARIHGTTVEKIHFHEVGALDAILDIVGFYVAAEILGVERFLYTTLTLGSGTAKAAHGDIPVPAPATLELLAGHRVVFSGREGELVTPTAAAIVSAVFEPVAADQTVIPRAVGYGAGTRECEGMPNVLRAVIGETHAAPRRLAVIRSTIDDMNPEVYGHVMSRLFDAGAREVYYQPVMMKKNRPGVELTLITDEEDAERIAHELMAQTTTLGVRVAREERVELERRRDTVETEYGTAEVKLAILPDGGERMSPEYEWCRRVAEETDTPILEVYDAVRRAWSARTSGRRRDP